MSNLTSVNTYVLFNKDLLLPILRFVNPDVSMLAKIRSVCRSWKNLLDTQHSIVNHLWTIDDQTLDDLSWQKWQSLALQLINKGSPIDHTRDDELTPIETALQAGNEKIFHFFLQQVNISVHTFLKQFIPKAIYQLNEDINCVKLAMIILTEEKACFGQEDEDVDDIISRLLQSLPLFKQFTTYYLDQHPEKWWTIYNSLCFQWESSVKTNLVQTDPIFNAIQSSWDDVFNPAISHLTLCNGFDPSETDEFENTPASFLLDIQNSILDFLTEQYFTEDLPIKLTLPKNLLNFNKNF